MTADMKFKNCTTIKIKKTLRKVNIIASITTAEKSDCNQTGLITDN